MNNSRSSEDLPAPDGPVRKWNEPGRRWKLTSERTSGPRSYLRPTLFNRITVSGSGSSYEGLASVRLYAGRRRPYQLVTNMAAACTRMTVVHDMSSAHLRSRSLGPNSCEQGLRWLVRHRVRASIAPQTHDLNRDSPSWLWTAAPEGAPGRAPRRRRHDGYDIRRAGRRRSNLFGGHDRERASRGWRRKLLLASWSGPWSSPFSRAASCSRPT